ncbi:gamma-glutamylcyclotransferase [Lysobacter sp. 22409]|uniref:gamma-glutamylcyclotransferase n=1 Tax=Lysobacter sp. 22409 TaxID=3453917 RepID=UPI003F82D199
MWVFGYGSLMVGGWEQEFGCDLRVQAVLYGYRRVFNKASVRNWGTQDCKCLTLNLEQSEGGRCVGIGFRFPDAERPRIMKSLELREGKRFPFLELPVEVAQLGEFTALVPLYNGPNVIPVEAISDAIRDIRQAAGVKGRCIDYVNGIHQILESQGIDDPVVRDVWVRANRSH